MSQTAAPPKKSSRLRAYDTLRFLAATEVFVVHAHCMTGWLDHLPVFLTGLLDAKAAVAFFFVLSGFVLHLSWKGEWPGVRSWLAFVTKRCFRIYPVYYVSLALAALVLLGLPLWGCPMFHDDASGLLILQSDRHDVRQWILHALLIVPGLNHQFLNQPIWTLVAEMQISLLFPWLSWLMRRATGIRGIVVVGLMFVFGPWIASRTFGTLELIPIFAVGALLAERRAAIVRVLHPKAGAALLIVGCVLYAGPGCFHGVPVVVRIYIASVAAALILTSVLMLPRFRTLLEWRPLAVGGDLSYGLYALHYPVLMAAAYATWKLHLPLWLFVVVSFTACLALALLLYRWLEVPCISYARGLASKITRQHDAPRASPKAAVID